MALCDSDTFDLIPPFGGWNTPYNEYDCNEICAGDGDYTPWTKRYVCAFCHVGVTADNIGLTVNFHICKDCIHTDKALEFLESQRNTGHTIGYEGSQQTSKGTISLQELVKQIAIKVGLYHMLYSEELPLLLLSRIDYYISKDNSFAEPPQRYYVVDLNHGFTLPEERKDSFAVIERYGPTLFRGTKQQSEEYLLKLNENLDVNSFAEDDERNGNHRFS